MPRLLYLLLLFFPIATLAQTVIVRPDLHSDTKIAPAYFGPNAFPVPDMLDESISSKLEVSLSGDIFKGDFGDKTQAIGARIRVPLFSSRVNLSAWVPVLEHYTLTPAWKENARIEGQEKNSGCDFGSAIISTDILLMKETAKRPAWALRAALKTASEDSWAMARYYDCPGYYFDTSFGKELTIKNSYLKALRLGASGGFLCWQTDNGRQNDATMYAVQFKVKFRHFDFSQDLRGYAGWEKDGDCPMVIKTQVQGHFQRFHPYISYQKGLQDYPYQQFSVGLSVDFDILRKQ